MKLEGTKEFDAPREVVWSVINDPSKMAKTMPGVESFEIADDTHWSAKVKVPLGLGGLKMSIAFTKLEERPLEFASLNAKGQGVGALMNMTTSFTLSGRGRDDLDGLGGRRQDRRAGRARWASASCSRSSTSRSGTCWPRSTCRCRRRRPQRPADPGPEAQRFGVSRSEPFPRARARDEVAFPLVAGKRLLEGGDRLVRLPSELQHLGEVRVHVALAREVVRRLGDGDCLAREPLRLLLVAAPCVNLRHHGTPDHLVEGSSLAPSSAARDAHALRLVEPVESVERLGEPRSRAREERLVAELLEDAAALCPELRGGGGIARELLHHVRLDRRDARRAECCRRALRAPRVSRPAARVLRRNGLATQRPSPARCDASGHGLLVTRWRRATRGARRWGSSRRGGRSHASPCARRRDRRAAREGLPGRTRRAQSPSGHGRTRPIRAPGTRCAARRRRPRPAAQAAPRPRGPPAAPSRPPARCT